MYCVNKIITWCLSPMGLLFMGLGFAWAVRRRCVLSRTLVGLTLALTWILGCGVTTQVIGLPLEGVEAGETQGCAVAELQDCNAIVLLGGGMGVHKKCGRAEMFGSADRVWTAARLWKLARLKGPKPGMPVFCSGGDVEKSTVPLLVDLGVPREAIVCLPQPRNTEEEARKIIETFRGFEASGPQGGKADKPKVLLVTSAWHMPRAKMLFERAGLVVASAPTDYEMHFAAELPLSIGDFFPNAESLVRNSYAVKEWVARFCYWVRG